MSRKTLSDLAAAKATIGKGRLPGWTLSWGDTGQATVTSPIGAVFLPPDHQVPPSDVPSLIEKLDNIGYSDDLERSRHRPVQPQFTAPRSAPSEPARAVPATTEIAKEPVPAATTTPTKKPSTTKPRLAVFTYPTEPQRVPLAKLLPEANLGNGQRYLIPKVIVDAEIARALLERAAEYRNRNIRKANKAKFKRFMLDGSFNETHQGIAFNENGDMSDGQHRMAALLEIAEDMPDSEIVVDITYNMPIDAALAFDGGAPRSNADHLRVAGISNPTVTSRLVRMLYLYTQTVGKPANWKDVPPLSADQMVGMSNKYGADLCAAYDRVKKMKFTDMNLSAAAVAYYLIKDRDPNGPIEDFVDGIVESDTTTYPDDARKALVRWCGNNRRRRVDARNYLAHFIYTYNDYVQQLPRQVNRWLPTQPIPEPYVPGVNKPGRTKRKSV